MNRWVVGFLFYIALISTATSVVVVLTVRAQAHHDAVTLRSAAIEGCRRQNDIREGNRLFFRHQRKQATEFNYRTLFNPNTPQSVIHKLRRGQIDFYSKEIHRNRPINCPARYPPV